MDGDRKTPSAHYDEMEKDLNQEPPLVYKKNNLVLEKVILDRALDKV